MSQVQTLVQPLPTQGPRSRPAVNWVQAAVLAVVVLLLYHRILAALVGDWWNDPNFSHGFFVPLFSAYVVWEKRHELAVLPVRTSWFGLVAIAGAMATLVIGVLGSELFTSRTSLLFLLGGLILFFRGWPWFRALMFPWLFLFLMVPIPTIVFNQIAFPLQLLASWLASLILPVFNVPVLREGNVIQLPSMPLEVAEACSGIRSLLSLGTLAIIYGHFLDSSSWRRVALAIAAVPIAVAANALRIVGTGLAVQYWNPERALGFFHEFSGWVIFVVSVGMLFLVHSCLRWFSKAEAKAN